MIGAAVGGFLHGHLIKRVAYLDEAKQKALEGRGRCADHGAFSPRPVQPSKQFVVDDRVAVKVEGQNWFRDNGGERTLHDVAAHLQQRRWHNLRDERFAVAEEQREEGTNHSSLASAHDHLVTERTLAACERGGELAENCHLRAAKEQRVQSLKHEQSRIAAPGVWFSLDGLKIVAP